MGEKFVQTANPVEGKSDLYYWTGGGKGPLNCSSSSTW